MASAFGQWAYLIGARRLLRANNVTKIILQITWETAGFIMGLAEFYLFGFMVLLAFSFSVL